MKTVSYFGRIYKCLPIRYNRNKGNFRFPKGEVTMKNNRKPIFWRRGLALLLAVCLAAGYVPVPGYAEGCTHAHGEDCYEVTTQCVHSHDESCYTDPAIMEAGEEPDACAHACAEETGCVTKALNCAHVHDSACGEAAEEEPKEEPQPEGKEEPKEEPKPQEELKEEPKEEPEAPQEPQVKTVTAWTWLDEEEALDPETGKLCLVASEEAPIFLDQIMEVLPQAIEATVDGEGETLPLAAWTCGEYPEDGAYEGSFVLEAELPEGYALGDGVEALRVVVEFGGAVTLGENAVGVSLDGSWTSYATFDEAMRAVVTEGLSARSVEVKLYGNATSTGAYTIRNGMTLDLNGNRLEGLSVRADFSVGVGTLTLRDSSQSGGGSSNVKFQTAGGRIQVDSGEWEDITARNGSVTVDGGGVIKITAYDTVTLKGGKIDFLAVDKASVISLSYGTFEGIRGINQKVLAADLLAPGYAFRWDHDQKLQRYKDLPTLDDNTAIGNTTVVQCQSHVFETGNPNCIYCNTLCTHSTVNQTTGACEVCGAAQYDARLTMGNTSTLYKEMNDAFIALGERVGTVTLLRDVNVEYFCVYQNNVLDGNGHTITGRLEISLQTDKKSGGVIQNLTLKGWHEVGREMVPVFGDNCVIYGFHTNGGELLALVQDGYAFYTDEGRTTFADPTVKTYEDVLYTGPHTHTKRQGYKTCACGYAFPYATVTKAPEPLKLTYTGQTQTLVTQGTAEGGEMLYSLEKDGYYGKTVPFGIVKTYTVYYMVRGDSGHLDTEPESVTVTIKPTKRLLDLTGLNLAGDITIDGVDYPIEASNDTLYVTIPETGDLFTYYGYKNIWASNEHSNYPTSMSVYAIERTPTGSTAREITELQDLLTYAGCSIRISGKQGIRMITALDEATKKALTGKGLAGYTLEEYGTVVSWTDALGNGSFLRLGESYARSNYAYRKGEADPVFARKNGVIQYTNVLVLENLTEADYDKDLTLRAYIRLRNTETGETVTLYGGTVTRSIYYVAQQNADTYKPGTAGHKFVHKIIDAVENRT